MRELYQAFGSIVGGLPQPMPDQEHPDIRLRGECW